MTRQIFVTTTIPYVNAPPHIGFALELVQADVIARYNRLIGRDVHFQTGTDENAFKNVLFRLSAYQSRLHELISSRRLQILPATREAEVLGFIERGLADISLSRDATRSQGWGIPYPGDETQVVYVWIDALINYLSGLGFPEGDAHRRWDDAVKCHVIGKNVWKFHAVYWPALLLSAGLAIPDRIVAHGFLTNEGRKISKSSGNAVDPVDYIDEFGADAVRYFLLRHVRPFDDSDFSVERLASVYNADLSNGIGNSTSRLTALCENAALSGITAPAGAPPSGFHEHVEDFRFDLALALL